jgi:ribose transport system substrate-binding protein
MKPGKDYVTVVTPDDSDNGVRATHLMARELGGKGKVGIIYHEADFPTTKFRYEACKSILKEKYPNIEVVAEQGISGPNFVADAEKAAGAFFLRYPDIEAIWGIWDVPAEGIIAAARTAGREKDLKIFTIDLGKNVAIEMAKGGMVKGIAAQTVFDAGIAEAKAAGLPMLGKPVPSWIVMKGLAVDKNNVLEAWKTVYHTEPPKELVDAAK